MLLEDGRLKAKVKFDYSEGTISFWWQRYHFAYKLDFSYMTILYKNVIYFDVIFITDLNISSAKQVIQNVKTVFTNLSCNFHFFLLLDMIGMKFVFLFGALALVCATKPTGNPTSKSV